MFVRTRFTWLVTCLAGLVVLTACSTPSGTQDTGEPAVPDVPAILTSVDLVLPVAQYLPTTAQNERFAEARMVLIQQCMRRFGVEYPAEPVTADQYGPRSLTDRRYGITDLALARTSGYGLGPRDPGLQKRPPRPEIGAVGENALIGEGQSIVNGLAVPEGGCVGQADRELTKFVPAGADLELGRKLQFQSFDTARRDSRVRSVFTSWSTCMAERGWHYADPLAAAADPKFTAPADAQQIAVAEADIACKATTNLVGMWFTVESAYQKRQIDQNAAGFSATRQALAERDRAAGSVIGRK